MTPSRGLVIVGGMEHIAPVLRRVLLGCGIADRVSCSAKLRHDLIERARPQDAGLGLRRQRGDQFDRTPLRGCNGDGDSLSPLLLRHVIHLTILGLPSDYADIPYRYMSIPPRNKPNKGPEASASDIFSQRVVGERLADAMRSRSVNQAALAQAVGVAQPDISRWIRGVEDRKPGIDVVWAMVRHLGINGHWLLTGEGDMDATPGEAEQILAEVRALVSPRSPLDLEGTARTAVGAVAGAPPVDPVDRDGTDDQDGDD